MGDYIRILRFAVSAGVGAMQLGKPAGVSGFPADLQVFILGSREPQCVPHFIAGSEVAQAASRHTPNIRARVVLKAVEERGYRTGVIECVTANDLERAEPVHEILIGDVRE